jgi:hypothetical protein
MTIIKFPDPEKPSFDILMRNPLRDRAEGVIQAFIHGMKEEGISRGMIIRTLFHHVIEELKDVPEDYQSTDAEDAEQTNILHEIDERWSQLRAGLVAADPEFFKTRE